MACVTIVAGRVDYNVQQGLSGQPPALRTTFCTVQFLKSDYSNGVALDAVQCGCGAILGIVAGECTQSDGTLRPLVVLWDGKNGKARCYLQTDPIAGGGVDLPLTEVTPNTHLADYDILRFLVLGY